MADSVRIDTVLQDTMIAREDTESTGGATEETGMVGGIGIVVDAGGATGTAVTDMGAVVETRMIMVGAIDMMTTDDTSDEDVTRMDPRVVTEMMVRAVTEEGAEEVKGAMVWVLPRGDPRHRKVQFHSRKESERLRGGMYMPLVMSSIVRCKPNKQVCLCLYWGFSASGLIPFLQGLFNLPGANRTQIPPILGIAGLPPPMPVQTFGMGIGANPNLSRQSRRLYIGSITPDVNEQNLADFFNAKMIEMNIGTGVSGNPVLAVQCNYEKNYAFVEVRLILILLK